ncbi:hypothetical protein [Sorangium sp. So ce128]|uniref:hypothetical protein n=1 Tax=Sorangium sp. So ce128 TaxID=3133281 RepID=UPI003F60AF4E
MESMAPVLDEECLVEALDALGGVDTRSAERITVRVGPAPIELLKRGTGWVLRRTTEVAHQTWERRFQEALDAAAARRAARLDEARQQEEVRRQEEARRQFVEERKATIVARAKEMGYSVREEKHGEEIRLVLVRRTW